VPLPLSARGGPAAAAGRPASAPRRKAQAGRAIAALAVAGAVALTAAGCSKFDAALGRQWATVSFKSSTSVATLLKVRAACSHVPNVHPEALPKKPVGGMMMYALTYRTDKASDANLAQLQQCLQRFPSVEGVDFQDSGDNGS
jgi:hypothetical protein